MSVDHRAMSGLMQLACAETARRCAMSVGSRRMSAYDGQSTRLYKCTTREKRPLARTELNSRVMSREVGCVRARMTLQLLYVPLDDVNVFSVACMWQDALEV